MSESDLLSSLTDVITTREFDTPYGVLPAGSPGTISYTHVGYLVDFAALVCRIGAAWSCRAHQARLRDLKSHSRRSPEQPIVLVPDVRTYRG